MEQSQIKTNKEIRAADTASGLDEAVDLLIEWALIR
jgi:hypothetical protein